MARSTLAQVIAAALLVSCSEHASPTSAPEAGAAPLSAVGATASSDAKTADRRTRMRELRAAQAAAGVEYAFGLDVASEHLAATNAGRGLHVTVEPSGVRLRELVAPATSVGLALEAWGCPGSPVAVHAGDVALEGRRAVVHRRAAQGPGVREWFENGPLGVEQGFDLAAPPPCSDPSRVELAVRVSGGLRPIVASDGESVTLTDERGTARLRYGELFVRDATERLLPARFEAVEDRIVIAFDATEAKYPVEVDPLVVTFRQQLAKAYGGAVALSGSTLAVGAWTEAQALVYTVAASTWTKMATLTGAGAASDARFGTDVAIDGGVIVVGAPFDSNVSLGIKPGAAYLYTGSGSTWTQQAQLFGNSPGDGDQFGASVSVDGDQALVGAPRNDSDGADAGAAYLFERSGSSWNLTATLKPSIGPGNTSPGYRFGAKVVLSGGQAFIGAPGAEKVYVISVASTFDRQIIDHPDAGSSAAFGAQLAVHGDTLLVGAPDVKNQVGKSGAYLYRYDGAAFVLDATLGSVSAGTGYASAVALLADDAFVGELEYDDGTSTDVGRVRWYQRSGVSWAEQTAVTPSVNSKNTWFGGALAVTDGWLAVGLPGPGGNVVEMFSLLDSTGSPCASSAECQTGSCVDGVCCASACSGACQACSAIAKGGGADGVCGPAAAGTDPHDACTAQTATTCGTTGVCDGSGACAFHVSGTGCAPMSCASETSQNEPRTCDGTGTCKPATVTPCQPGYRCTGNACLTSCANDGECAAGYYCNAGVCAAVKGQGASCTKASMCQSGHCVDGVCCESACAASCMACSGAKNGTADGTCANVPSGQDPDDDCAASGGVCGLTGQCNGAGACAYAPSGKACGATTCVGNSTTGSICDGAGTCKVDNTGTDCAPYVCSTTTNACTTPCTNDGECVAGHFCAQGTCLAKRAAGLACALATECVDGNCVDGVCCATACTGLCQACAASLKASGADSGICGAAAAGTDPRSQCTDDGSTTCQKNGFCDGAGQCALYPAGTQCGAPGCSGDAPTSSECDGAGQCKLQSAASCFPAACDVGVCVGGACVDDDGCSKGKAYCDAGTCVKKHSNGDACGAPRECESGFCIDGVCCNTACDGQCEACDLSGAAGTCSGVTGAPHGSRAPCAGATGSDVCTAKTCDPNKSVSACAGFVTSGDCRAQSCADGVETFTAACDGSGTCPATKTKQCTPYVCGGDKCLDSCKTNADCGEGTICDAPSGKCKPGSSCVDDYTVQEAGKAAVSCLPYRCVAAKCQTECKSVDDCAPGSVCDTTFRCVAAGAGTDAPAEDSGGCGCSVPGGQDEVPGTAWLAGAAVGIALARRRRGARRAA